MSAVEEAVSAWLNSTFNQNGRPSSACVEVTSGPTWLSRSGASTYFFCEQSSPVLAGLSVHDMYQRRYAASRLGQTVDDLEDAPDFFLRTLFEPACCELAAEVAGRLGTPSGDAGMTLAKAGQAIGGFEADARYVLMEVEPNSDVAFGTLSLLFERDAILAEARKMTAGQGLGDWLSGPTPPDAVKGIGVDVFAVLAELEMKISDCVRFEADQLVPLDDASLGSVSVIASGETGGPVNLGRGELGAWKSSRAIRMTSGSQYQSGPPGD